MSNPQPSPLDFQSLIRSLPSDQVVRLLNREIYARDFSEFVRNSWHVVEPGRLLVWGWHLKAKCDHLQAVFRFTAPEESLFPEERGLPNIRDIIINEPPRCSKSLFTSVLFPAWVWTRWLGARFLNITYADDLAQRDALKCRNLVESPWYQSHWPSVRVNDDQRAKSRYNVGESGGFRVSTTILGMATGEGGDFRLLDDPHNVKKSLSDVERQQANLFYDLTLPTRVVDPKRSSTIICMQRLHEDDLTGHALAKETKYDKLILPMEYEEGEGNRCETALGFRDPRRKNGELLHPERWDRKAVEKLKSELRSQFGDFGIDSQLQQRPTPPGGGMFKPDNLILVPEWPPMDDLERIVRFWDKAATEGSGAYTAGALMARRRSTQRTIILDIVRGQWNTDRREQTILHTSHQDRRRLGDRKPYAVRIEQEPGSGGKDSALWTAKSLSGFNVRPVPKTISKEVDWAPLASQVNLGGVEVVSAPWNGPLKTEMKGAPFGKFRDQLDACSGGFKYIWLSPVARVLG